MFFSTSRLLHSVRRSAAAFANLSDAQLKEKSLEWKYAAMRDQIRSQLAEPFGLVTEAVRRRVGKEYFDVQLLGGIEMARGAICEMKTGEGKTLTAALPAFFYGLSGLGCHVVTVNDYLAKRDLEILQPVYDLLGLSSGVIQAGHSRKERTEIYRRDITYGTAKEFGFDFLRDRMASHRGSGLPQSTSMRGLNAVVIDEADSILLDEARTPLIIGTTDRDEAARTASGYQWAARHASTFEEGQHFYFDERKRQIQLTTAGFQRMGQLEQNAGTLSMSNLELKEYIERAIYVARDFHRDKHYAIRSGEIVIIDEFTGRPAEGRQWQAGLHQSIEAKEGLSIKPQTMSAASVTMQHFFRLYTHVCGMTGTAMSSRHELKKAYGLATVAIPTHRPVQRKRLPTLVFENIDAKFNAVVAEIRSQIDANRAVLVGTRSIEKSVRLSKLLQEVGIAHNVLNANHLAAEAEIVAQAGQPRAVTVATNMAGRGTDIHLHPDVLAAGGLHVILTEIHESQRIDAQLIGRCSRQGDPGSYRIFASMDDEILKLGFGEETAKSLQKRYTRAGDSTGQVSGDLFKRLQAAQRATERKHRTDRMALLRREKEQIERTFETGQDIYLDALR